MTTPAVGRSVHYVARGSADGVYPPACRAAVITEVERIDPDGYRQDGDQPNLGLCVLNPTGIFLLGLGDNRGVRHGAGHHDDASRSTLCGGQHYPPGTWHWPVHV